MLAVIWKDIMLESRSRETISALFVLGLVILLIFNFAIDVEPANVSRLAPGMLWIAIVFSAMLGLGRVFVIERENGCMTALVLAPVERGSLYLAKLLVNVVLLLVFEALLLPVFALMFGLDLSAYIVNLIVVLGAGSLGLAAAGTLFALAALGTRARELMLPLIVLPLQIPLLIAAVKATDIVMRDGSLAELGGWGEILVAFDVIFVTVGWLAFEFISVD
ncbi:MAG: heme exporter protein CcmB [Candidatus Binatia bacterium]